MLTIGADPEFILLSRKSGEFVQARHVVKRCNGVVGTDGCTSTGELRPGVAVDSPLLLTTMVRQAMLSLATVCQREHLSVLAGHYPHGVPIGGHLHFGVTFDGQHRTALEQLLDPFSEEVDDLSQRTERERIGYGKAGNTIETKPWGFEYRVPGSWLLSPAMTLAVITLGTMAVKYTTDLMHDTPVEQLPLTQEEIFGWETAMAVRQKGRPDWSQNCLENWL